MSSRISILWGLGEINQVLVTWQCEWNRERKSWQAKMEFMGAAGTHILLQLTSSWQIYISKLVVNCHGWGANTSFLCVSCFLHSSNLGQRGRQGSYIHTICSSHTPASSGWEITALGNIHIHLLSYTLDNSPYHTSGMQLAEFSHKQRRKERHSLLEDIPNLESSFREL